ncbi:hypothetical protein FS837_001161 [Tulasnella sp. UAMH 9824]|nr:hypothetical protein FS837_001161 [Tulasnella sp. UAMH 9824]
MQIKRQANSTSRAKALVNKTKDLFSAFTNTLKYSENKARFSLSEGFQSTPPTFEDRTSAIVDYEHDPELELFYPAPPFFRRFTSSSQRSGSTESTSTASSSILSHHTYRTATTVAGDGKQSNPEKEDVTADEATGIRASGLALHNSDNLIHPSELARGSFPLRANSRDDEEDEEEEILFMPSKRVASLQPGFATFLSRNPYAAFLSQPLYKPPYIFPAGRFVDPNNA